MKITFVFLVLFFAGVLLWTSDARAQSCPGTLMSQEWIECKQFVLGACAYVGPRESSSCEIAALRQFLQLQQIQRIQQQQQSGATAPVDAWQCPGTHPIKGNFTPYTAPVEKCIFHLPGGQFYNATKPEKCYRTPQDALVDGCRQSLK